MSPSRGVTKKYLGLALCSGAVVALVAWSQGAGWPAAGTLGVLFAGGVYAWYAATEPKKWSDLGQGILIGVLVSLALLVVQRGADQRLREVTDRQAKEAREADQRRSDELRRRDLQRSLSQRRSLREYALAGEDLRRFVLSRRDLRGALLDRARVDLAGFCPMFCVRSG
jgi:hypothetical protein